MSPGLNASSRQTDSRSSGLVDKLKSKTSKALSKGDKLPTSGALKEDNPEKGTVDLSSLPGKSKSSHHLSHKRSVSSDKLQRHHRRCPRRLHTTLLLASPRLRRARRPVRLQGRPWHLHRGCERCFHHTGVEREARSQPLDCAFLG